MHASGRTEWISRTTGLAMVAGLAALAGCGALPSYESTRAALPADEFVQLDGQWVHYERAGAGAPVLLLHGFGESTYSWRKILPGLARDLDVVALDLNGFGYTERPVGVESYAVDGQVDLVLGLMDELSFTEAQVVGHSYGTSVAVRLAERAPDRVRTLVLIAGVPGSDDIDGRVIPPLVRPFLTCLATQLLLTPAQVREILAAASFVDDYITDEVVDEYLRRLRLEGLDRAIGGLLAQLDAEPLDVDLPAIVQPTLVIWGRHDPLYAVELGENLAQALPNAAFVLFEDAGHLVMEEQPDELLGVVSPFLVAHTDLLH